MMPAKSMSRYVRALYPLGFMLSVIPLIDWAVRVYPFFPGQLQWRFGAEAALVAGMGIMLTGLGLMGLIATYCDHRVVLRVLAGASATGAVLTFGLLGLFLLDASQIRSGVSEPDLQAGLTKALITGSVTALAGGAVLVSLARGMWLASRSQDGRSEPRSDVMLVRPRAASDSPSSRATP